MELPPSSDVLTFIKHDSLTCSICNSHTAIEVRIMTDAIINEYYVTVYTNSVSLIYCFRKDDR